MAYLYFKNLGNQGRLGNSLFQVAATIGIAHANNMHPLFPANWKYRSVFNIPDEYFGDCAIQAYYKEPHFHFAAPSIDSTKNTEITGYSQSEQYWHHCKEDVIKWLTPKGAMPSSVDAVAIHHRRGDYVGNPNYQQLGMNYYISAYDEGYKGKEIRAFSDDHNYIDLHYGGNTLKAQPSNEIDDFKNMIACQYHICSNSTFSWWGAYLSGSLSVIRPERYFDRQLAKANDTKDLWPPRWCFWNENKKVNFEDVTFIIPVKFDSEDRTQNIVTVLKYLRSNFACNIIIGEINGDMYVTHAFLYDAKYIGFNMPAFHRTKVLNELTKAAKTKFVFNIDADAVCSPWQIYAAVERLRNGVDVVYPFNGSVANVPRHALQRFFNTLDCGEFAGKMWPWMTSTYKSVGMMFGYNKESFLMAGGENETFVSYGGEDQERYMRFKRLGLRVERINGTVFHMDHFRGINSSERHPDSHGNRIAFENELKQYREWCIKTGDKDIWRPFQSSTGKICNW